MYNTIMSQVYVFRFPTLKQEDHAPLVIGCLELGAQGPARQYTEERAVVGHQPCKRLALHYLPHTFT